MTQILIYKTQGNIEAMRSKVPVLLVEYIDKPIDPSNVSFESLFISITRENFLSTVKKVA